MVESESTMHQDKNPNRAYLRLLIATLLLLCVLVVTLIVSQNFLAKRFSAVKFDINAPLSLNDNGLWGPKLNHERLLLRLENEFINGDESDDGRNAAFMNERWLDLGPALFYKADTVELRAEYHVLFLLYSAESKDVELFNRILSIIRDNFLTDDALLRKGLRSTAANPPANLQDEKRVADEAATDNELSNDRSVWLDEEKLDDTDFYSSLIYMRALALEYTNRGDKDILDLLKKTSASYLSLAKKGLPPAAERQITITVTPPVFVGEEGKLTSVPTLTPKTETEIKEISLIRLYDIDLYTLRILEALDSQYAELYENASGIMKDAIRDGHPLFAEAYNPNSSSYVLYTERAEVSLDHQLKIMLSLAEAELLPPASLAWLKSRLNNYELVETYSLQDVSMMSSEILPLRYGQICRLARSLDDSDLYGRSLDRLLEANISTVSQSPIYGMIFRHPSVKDDVQLTLADNVWALLGSY